MVAGVGGLNEVIEGEALRVGGNAGSLAIEEEERVRVGFRMAFTEDRQLTLHRIGR
jgi:hypothetical protein